MQCAAGPHLQRLQGCFTEAPRVFAKYAGFEFTRCPVRYHTTQGILLLRAVRRGDQRFTNAKGEEAWRYVEWLIQLQAAQEKANDGN